MDLIQIVFYVLVLIFSVVIHEVSHGVMARRLGDRTAEHEGRLTLNPIVHLDLFGSILLPALLIIVQSPFLIGWAKPVPYNPYNFFDTPFIRKWGEALVAVAGPVSNIIIFLFFGLFLRFFGDSLMGTAFEPSLLIINMVVIVNIVLAVFNLVPIPPLDGSKILFAILPSSLDNVRDFLERNALIVALFFIFFLWDFISPLVGVVYGLVLGL